MNEITTTNRAINRRTRRARNQMARIIPAPTQDVQASQVVRSTINTCLRAQWKVARRLAYSESQRKALTNKIRKMHRQGKKDQEEIQHLRDLAAADDGEIRRLEEEVARHRALATRGARNWKMATRNRYSWFNGTNPPNLATTTLEQWPYSSDEATKTIIPPRTERGHTPYPNEDVEEQDDQWVANIEAWLRTCDHRDQVENPYRENNAPGRVSSPCTAPCPRCISSPSYDPESPAYVPGGWEESDDELESAGQIIGDLDYSPGSPDSAWWTAMDSQVAILELEHIPLPSDPQHRQR